MDATFFQPAPTTAAAADKAAYYEEYEYGPDYQDSAWPDGGFEGTWGTEAFDGWTGEPQWAAPGSYVVDFDSLVFALDEALQPCELPADPVCQVDETSLAFSLEKQDVCLTIIEVTQNGHSGILSPPRRLPDPDAVSLASETPHERASLSPQAELSNDPAAKRNMVSLTNTQLQDLQAKIEKLKKGKNKSTSSPPGSPRDPPSRPRSGRASDVGTPREAAAKPSSPVEDLTEQEPKPRASRSKGSSRETSLRPASAVKAAKEAKETKDARESKESKEPREGKESVRSARRSRHEAVRRDGTPAHSDESPPRHKVASTYTAPEQDARPERRARNALFSVSGKPATQSPSRRQSPRPRSPVIIDESPEKRPPNPSRSATSSRRVSESTVKARPRERRLEEDGSRPRVTLSDNRDQKSESRDTPDRLEHNGQRVQRLLGRQGQNRVFGSALRSTAENSGSGDRRPSQLADRDGTSKLRSGTRRLDQDRGLLIQRAMLPIHRSARDEGRSRSEPSPPPEKKPANFAGVAPGEERARPAMKVESRMRGFQDLPDNGLRRADERGGREPKVRRLR
mmetsp:Transcript_5204/g.12330  ORF Transcript_5204/g.12330 Transcript_5204/m.12330 type:complete len:569 (+) Transcript_5204:63-1769(+)